MNFGGWFKEFLFRPNWAFCRMRDAFSKHLNKNDTSSRVSEYREIQTDVFSAVSMATDAKIEFVQKLIKQFPKNLPRNSAVKNVVPEAWAASQNLMKLYYLVCKILAPKLVIETGVAAGYSTSIILHCLNDIENSKLISIECPDIGVFDLSYIGNQVPETYKSKWQLVTKPSALALPELEKFEGKVDVFIHDSDHHYENQSREYRFAMRVLKSQGILISDDVDNNAFIEICDRIGCKPIIVERSENGGFIGLVRKP